MAARRRLVRALVAVVAAGLLLGSPLLDAGPTSAAAVPALPRQTSGPQLPGPGSGTDDAGRRARHILQDPDYKPRAKAESLIDKIQKWISDHTPHPSAGGRGMPKGVSFVVLAVVVAGALAALIWGLKGLRRGRKKKDDEADDEGDIEIIPLRSVDEWKVEAERLEAEGRWREALRARYRQLVGQLIDDKQLGDLPGRTPGEFRMELATSVPEATSAFEAATTMFEIAWYGHRETYKADVERFQDLAASVRAEAGKRRRRSRDDERAEGEPVPAEAGAAS